jgi:uncharacterized protein YtpQ (UPF0354 family)
MFGFLKKAVSPAPPAPVLRATQLQPRIKHTRFLQALGDANVPLEQWPSTAPLCGELLVTYAFDVGDSFMMATPNLLEQTGIRPDELQDLARANLVQAMPAPQFFAKDGCGLAVTGEDLEATLLLVDDIWDSMQENFRGEILATVPCRDRLLVCDSADPRAMSALRLQSEEHYDEHQGPHRLSMQVMVRRHGGWVLYEGH